MENIGRRGVRLVIFNKIDKMAEEYQKIQKYVIKSTPYGELNDVLKDLDKLAPLDTTAPAISQALMEYNEDHLSLVAVGPGVYYPLMAVCRIEPGRYVDQLAKKIHTVDYLKG
jgi:hypothetical protein